MRAFVLHPDMKADRARRLPDHGLAEAVALAAALPGIEVVRAEIVRLPKAMPGLLFGTGKVEELKALFAGADVGLVLVDGPVTPVQQRNLERAWGVKLLDRTGLILEIFGDRARTREGVLQVELAALSYQRTRLVRAWTHLERQRGSGGQGFMGGPGETQIESDRRAIDDAVLRIKRALAKVAKTRELHRAARKKVPYPVVALVGYTNAGKSTLFNRLTGASVMAEDLLFATLDPTMRSIRLPGIDKAILSDTVGFISDLPTQLVAAFRATLEEVTAADCIVHVRDIASPATGEQKSQVEEILADLEVIAAPGGESTIPIIEAWNKWDLLNTDDAAMRRDLVQVQPSGRPAVAISAVTGEGVEALLERISGTLSGGSKRYDFVLGAGEGQRIAWLHANGEVLADEAIEGEEGPQRRLSVRLAIRDFGRFSRI